MMNGAFTITSHGGFYEYPVPPELPFAVRISLRGVSAGAEIERLTGAGPLVLPRQVHGTRVINAGVAATYPERDEADGILIGPASPVCGLRFADCAPVIIVCTDPKPWVLALHSGFRGTLNNITAAGLDFARGVMGESCPKHLYAWVGPCIGGACYDRSRDDTSTVAALDVFEQDAAIVRGNVVLFDLKKQIAYQLERGGVFPEHIYIESQCTHCNTDLFYSHRRSVPGNDPRMLLTVVPRNI